MVTRSRLQLVHAESHGLDAWRAKIAARLGGGQAVLDRALDFVQPLYEGRASRGGEPLLAHVLDASLILAELKLDPDAIATALLYPAYESAAGTAQAIRDEFGVTVADLAEGVVRMAQIGALSTRHQDAGKAQQLEALRKMLLAMVQDVRVVLIKLADHLQDLRHLARGESTAARTEAAEMTRDLFAPLANRLGVWHVKWELEDLAFRILEPDTYKRIARLLDEKRLDRETYIEAVVTRLEAELARSSIAGEVSGRPKHLYSIYKKMQRKGIGFEALRDVRAVRVLVEDVKDCYGALGIVHDLWSPIAEEFDDYIAKPKSNNYRSLHTAVIGPEQRTVEIQIRTFEMHQHSELGVAAHWRYKEEARRERGYDEKIAWLRQVLEWKDEVGDAGDIADQYRNALFADTIYVLTPQGRVIDLPRGATPVDFAYHVHSELGHRCRGAKVDGAIVPLNTPLQNGQRVEILAAKQGGPSRDWLTPALGFLKSQGARSKVRQWFNRQNFEADVIHGRALLEKELHRQGRSAMNLDKLAADLGYEKLDDFLVDVARGQIGPKQLQETLNPTPVEVRAEEPLAPAKRKARAAGQSSVLVVGVDKLLTATAKCCKPIPPDEIVGFVTRGRGVTVHRADCGNLARLDAERRISAEWSEAPSATFAVDVMLEAIDRTGLLRDISEVLTRERINVTATATQSASHVAYMRFTLEVQNLAQLERVLTLVRDVKGVMSAVRR